MKLSIITVNYNGAEGLKKTLESVQNQSFKDFEQIVVDGGSTDNSVEIIKDYAQKIDNYRWVSERDNGIYDGMNKGIGMATGEYLYFLNGGDCLVDEHTLEKIVGLLDGSAIVTGRVNLVINGCKYGETEKMKESDLTMYQMFLHGINHQSAIIKRELQLAHPYDITAKIGADWKFFVETIVLEGVKMKMTDCLFANFDRTGVSSNNVKLCEERKQLIYDLLPQRVADDYLAVAPYYYEVIRVEWLIRHPLWYKLYRGIATLGRKIDKL